MQTPKTQKKDIILHPIGLAKTNEEEGKFWIEIFPEYRPALKELEKFSHAHIIWWADRNDTESARKTLISEELPPFYGKDAPSMGVFANRSELRPNPILITSTPILSIDQDSGIISIPWFDGLPNSPVIDIKPYLRMTDIIADAKYPEYLQHWPNNQEEAIKWFSEQ